MKRYILCCAIIIANGVHAQVKQPGSNSLKKVFNTLVADKNATQLDLGNLILYFEKNPLRRVTEKKVGNRKEYIWFFADINIPDQLRAKLTEATRNNGDYSVDLHEVSGKKQGLELKVTFDPRKVEVRDGEDDSIKHERMFVLRLYNKESLDKLNAFDAPILQTACRSVVIDCGHGGNDFGAIGCNGVREKDICLGIGKQVASLLQLKGIAVHMPRDRDITIEMDQRAIVANQSHADVFISIHANSAASKSARGVETYFVKPELFCAIEPNKKLLDCLKQRCEKSKKLAQCIHSSILDSMPAQYKITDRKVKSALSQVLVGTMMPAVLLEIGFVTHPDEAQLLAQLSYQKQVAQGIVGGILEYLK